MGSLYVVSTPIGNLEDITLRALKVLGDTELIAAEDTRKAKALLNHYRIKNRVISFYEHNRTKRIPYLIEQLKIIDVALISEAGTPGMSDPGFELIKAAVENGINVIPVPGASALLSALAVSDLPVDGFKFIGFLPRYRSQRIEKLKKLKDEPGTLVFFEAPHRLKKTLADVLEVFGDRRVNICREMTKLYEEVFRGKISEAQLKFESPKGEFTIIISGSPEETSAVDQTGVKKLLGELVSQGCKGTDVIRQAVGRTGLPRNKVYRLYLELKKEVQQDSKARQ